ncbi:hypothetical protein ANTPLA_LOCUS1635 [Anthophora plagiata]
MSVAKYSLGTQCIDKRTQKWLLEKPQAGTTSDNKKRTNRKNSEVIDHLGNEMKGIIRLGAAPAQVKKTYHSEGKVKNVYSKYHGIRKQRLLRNLLILVVLNVDEQTEKERVLDILQEDGLQINSTENTGSTTAVGLGLGRSRLERTQYIRNANLWLGKKQKSIGGLLTLLVQKGIRPGMHLKWKNLILSYFLLANCAKKSLANNTFDSSHIIPGRRTVNKETILQM